MVMSGWSVHLTTLFSWASLTKLSTSTSVNQYFLHILLLVADKTLLESAEEGDGHRNYFMINLHESTGMGRDQTPDLWICSQTCYWLGYGNCTVFG